MIQINKRMKSMAGVIWSHMSAAVAVLLIVLALIIGVRIGSLSPSSPNQPDAEEHAHDSATNDLEPVNYTCSMHPTVRLEDPDAKCPICFMDLIPVRDHAVGDDNRDRLILSEYSRLMSRIETAKVERFFPIAEVRLFGKLAYDETSVARISAYFPGRIDRLFVNYTGVPVQQGDHLAEIYSPDLLAAVEELRQAKQSSEDSQTSENKFLRETASQTLRAVQEKLRLFGLTSQQIDEIESGSFDSDQLTIYAPIGGIVTHLSMREGDYLETGDPIATVANLSRLWLDLEAYESQLPLLHWGLPVTFTVEAHPGEVFDGMISFIEPIVDDKTRTASVRVAVDNSDHKLKPGMFATAVALPQISASGVVMPDDLAGRWISPMHPTVIKDVPGTCDVCGMDLISAEEFGIVGDPSAFETPLVIPRSAVLFTGKRSVVYVEVENTDQPTYEGRTIQLGPRAGDYYTVRSGLRASDKVVTNGAFRIDSAMQIIAKPSMMMPEGGQGSSVHQHNGPSEHTLSEPVHNAPDTFVKQLEPIYANYFEAQEHLAADDLAGFQAATTRLNSRLSALDESGISLVQRSAWHRARAQLQTNAPMPTIDEARIHFETMSLGIIALQDHFGHSTQETWSTAFCPMAFDFKGAKWLQRGTQINNPYFGDAMLRCGDIQQSHDPINTGPDVMRTNEHEVQAHE